MYEVGHQLTAPVLSKLFYSKAFVVWGLVDTSGAAHSYCGPPATS